jgi:hypothetical protein
MNLKNWLRRRYRRFLVRFYRFGKSNSFVKTLDEESGYERLCGSIVRKMISHPESKFSIAPLSYKRYIINQSLDLFIIIEDNRVEITNHIYHYVIKLSNKETTKLTKQFDAKLEKIRIQYEDEIKSQVTNTLQKIFDKVNRK